ncbi:phage late control D family protein [Chromobacterium sp. IIBBL 290-4]|uniref:phage late control D family protein n=1 Tax=Chromobacterium sp. IIBBL 290-4 TaxID=2953890 RepID=UPI0020B72F6F|nr:contractile injection system protein, VgrG/Pvc8 family [Chromobacterium sp. IIBBL 290-4]UTH76091.1 contractile injection system protein, VgrG/Pvc8 family [Chromobacterium sp. IIBBL 290-4]
MSARRLDVAAPVFELSYNGKSITADIALYALNISYTDHLSGESDELEVELEDSDGRWLNGWYPDKGATLDFKLGYRGQALVSMGSFDVDEVEYSAPPSTVHIRALATGVQHPLRTRQGRAYEKKSLQQLAQQIAGLHGMKLEGKIEAVEIDRLTQYHETDLAFLQRVAGNYGYVCKVMDNNRKLVFWKRGALLDEAGVRTFSPADLISWRARDQLSQVPSAVEVSYHDTQTRKLQTARVAADARAPGGKASSADVVKLTRKSGGKTQAEQQAKAEMERRQLERTQLSVTVDGAPQLAAGRNVELSGFGKLSGRYLIERARHRLSRQDGYLCELDLKRAAPAAKELT